MGRVFSRHGGVARLARTPGTGGATLLALTRKSCGRADPIWSETALARVSFRTESPGR